MVLDFDHRGAKKANVSDLVLQRAPLHEIRAEIAKCDVRCANCHRRRTVTLIGGYRLRPSVTREGLEPSALTFVV